MITSCSIVPDPSESEAVDEPLEIGTVLDGRYRVVRPIGRGGMGRVYEGRQLVLDRRVAIKVLRSPTSASVAANSRFEREASAMARIQSAHVVSVFDFGRGPRACPYLVMEYLEGRDLRALLKEHRALAAPRAARLLQGVCRGLAAAHEQGVIHRDLKPENLFVVVRDGAESCKVLDFGLAKLLDTCRPEHPTQAGIPLGTLHYMSPEQARGDTDIDERADVYGCAAVLYELLTGKRPHVAESAHALLYRIIHEDPARADHVYPDVPAALADIVQAALARDRKQRPASIGDFEAMLRPFAGASPVSGNDRSSLGSEAETLSGSTAQLLGAASAPTTRPRTARTHGHLRLVAGMLIGSGTTWLLAAMPPRADVDVSPGQPPTRTDAAGVVALASPRPSADAASTESSIDDAAPAKAGTNDRSLPRPKPLRPASPKASRERDVRPDGKATSSFERRNPYE